jgi:hypothetical protein
MNWECLEVMIRNLKSAKMCRELLRHWCCAVGSRRDLQAQAVMKVPFSTRMGRTTLLKQKFAMSSAALISSPEFEFVSASNREILQ